MEKPYCENCAYRMDTQIHIINGEPELVAGDFCLWAPRGTGLLKMTFCPKCHVWEMEE